MALRLARNPSGSRSMRRAYLARSRARTCSGSRLRRSRARATIRAFREANGDGRTTFQCCHPFFLRKSPLMLALARLQKYKPVGTPTFSPDGTQIRQSTQNMPATDHRFCSRRYERPDHTPPFSPNYRARAFVGENRRYDHLLSRFHL
jgi:hypothetical protein